MTIIEGYEKVSQLILDISKEDDITAQLLLEHLIDYALEARDIRQALITEDDSPFGTYNPNRLIIH